MRRIDPDQGSSLAARRDRHVAPDQECEPTEHLLLGEAGLAGDQLADAVCELLVVRHGGDRRASRLDPCSELLEAWFAQTGRDLPWRKTTDPYAILVSEVMAQQTQVDRVVPRWERWLERWPTVDALAAASAADVIREWQGLGYNRRALSLHRAAQHVAAHGWPDDLTELPGVGRYTADAVACFAFGRDVLPVDVNVRRVQERTGHAFDVRRRAGADGSRRDRLPRAHPALRRLPARRAAAPRAAGASSRCASRARSRARSGSGGPRRSASSPTPRRPLAELDEDAVASLARDGLVRVVEAGTAFRLPAWRS